MYQALYRKYRPTTLNEVGGQDTIVKIIKNSIANNKISHAYLFAGPRGTGKTSIAKIFAKMVNCENLQDGIPCNKCVNCTQKNNSDIIEIDAASNNGVDEIRELRNKVNLVPSYGQYKVYIIDEVHMLTTGAFNALLKTLEEPPIHIVFILATTDPHKIPETILSRCQRLDFKKISENNIVARLKTIAVNEQIKVDDDALREIARLSDGGMRDSIGILDQAIAYSDDKITKKDIHDINGTLTAEDLKELINLLVAVNLEQILKKLDFYNDSGKNFVKLTEEIITFMRDVLLCGKAPEYFKQIHTNIEVYEDLVANLNSSQLINYLDELNNCVFAMKNTNNPKLLLELTIIKMLGQTTIEKAPEKIIQKNDAKEPKIEEKPKEEKKEVQKIVKEDTKLLPDHIKELRINNTLAKFNKKTVQLINNKLTLLTDYLLDPEIGKYASVILDGALKAASEDNLIFVYKTQRLTNLFNDNLINLETTLEKVLESKYKIIATDAATWDKIKNEFNSKTKTYEYIEENFKLEDLFRKENTAFSVFEDIIEYN